MLHKCEGIVLKASSYGETNKLVRVYTRELGKVGFVARGAKKSNSRLSAVTQPFTYGYFNIRIGTGLGTLVQGELSSSMRYIREDIFKTAYASYIVELLDKAVDEKESNPFLFELLSQSLHYINEGYDPEILTNIFEMKVLPVLGMYPVLDQCVNCGSYEGEFQFSIKLNGLLCHRCYQVDAYHLQTSQTAIKLIRLFLLFDLNRLGNISVKEETKKEIRYIIDHYYEEYTGLYLQSKKFLKQIDQFKDILDE